MLSSGVLHESFSPTMEFTSESNSELFWSCSLGSLVQNSRTPEFFLNELAYVPGMVFSTKRTVQQAELSFLDLK